MLKKKWSQWFLEIRDLPSQISQTDVYNDQDWWIDYIRTSPDRNFIGIWFTDGTSHMWCRSFGQNTQWLQMTVSADAWQSEPIQSFRDDPRKKV